MIMITSSNVINNNAVYSQIKISGDNFAEIAIQVFSPSLSILASVVYEYKDGRVVLSKEIVHPDAQEIQDFIKSYVDNIKDFIIYDRHKDLQL